MNIALFLEQARKGRPDLAAMNLGAAGFSKKALRVFVRYCYKNGEQTTVQALSKLYSFYRAQADSAYCC